MVSTRKHPRDFPPPAIGSSPTKSSRNSTSSPTPSSPALSPSQALSKRAISNSMSSFAPKKWTHTAPNLTLLWLAISLPLVIWDCLYILLRPHTMAGGFLQWPIWKPYEIYASIDYVYGWPALEENDGFGGAQGVLNAIETTGYAVYLWWVLRKGTPAAEGRGVRIGGLKGWFAGGRQVQGSLASKAAILGFTMAVMTLSKSVLYYFNEYFSGFKGIGHNDMSTIILFYGIMNGLWVLFPSYMVYVFGTEILQGLDLASGASSTSSKKTL